MPHPDESPSQSPPTPEERARIAVQAHENEHSEARTRLAEMLARSTAYRDTLDLHSPLTDSLLAEDEMAEAAAIFLEWHRRDPLHAFDELARRPSLQAIFTEQDPLFLHFSVEELVTQFSLGRPENLRTMILDGLGKRLGTGDDLAGLAAAMSMLDAASRDALAKEFVQSGWVPRDGAAACGTIDLEMPEPIRKSLLRALAGAYSFSLTRVWSEGIGAPLFDRNLSEAERSEIADANFRSSQGSSCGGGMDEEDVATSDGTMIKPLEPEITGDEAGYALQARLSVALDLEKDYRECFASGAMDADGIMADMIKKIPGADAYPGELARVLYKELARENPLAASRWGASRLTPQEIAKSSKDILLYNQDPRTKRLAEMLRDLQVDFPDEEDATTRNVIGTKFRNWRALDPAAADRASAIIPANHPFRGFADGSIPVDEP